MELRRALFEEGGRALFLVLGCGAQAEVGGLEQRAFALARLQTLVRHLERELDGNGSVGGDFLQDGFGAPDEISRRNELVDETDTIGLLRCDHLAREDELQSATLADQPRQSL